MSKSLQMILGFNPATITLSEVVSKGMSSVAATLQQLAKMINDAKVNPAVGQVNYKKTIYPVMDVKVLNTAGQALSASDFSFFSTVSANQYAGNVTVPNAVPEGQIWLVHGLGWQLVNLPRTTANGVADRLNFTNAQGTVTMSINSDQAFPLKSVPFEALPYVEAFDGNVSQVVTTQGPTGASTVVSIYDTTTHAPNVLYQNISPEILLGKQTYRVTVHFDNPSQVFNNAITLRLYLMVVQWTNM
jgi:hypothetical protein